MKFLFSPAKTGDDPKQVETGETGINTSVQSEILLKTSTVDHQGRFTMKSNLWINDSENVLQSQIHG